MAQVPKQSAASSIPLRVKRLRESDLPLPAYKTELSAGLDLVADLDGDMVMTPMGRVAVPTGLAIELLPGYEAQVRPRSGLALNHGVTVANAPGTIDADYRGEVKVILVNLSNQPYTIRRGDRIAQMVVAPVSRVVVERVNELADTARGEGGFGSTGR